MKDTVVVKFIPAKYWWKRAKWELQEEYISSNGEVKVPAGFITDGASIPMFARAWFSPTGRYFGASIVHDYILVTERDWSKANDQFEAELNALGITKWRKVLLLASVKLWGWFIRNVLRKNSYND